jgi:hypothetical protein
MKRCLSSLVVILLLCGTVSGVDLGFTLDFHPGSGDAYKSLYEVNTDTGEVSRIFTQPEMVRHSEPGLQQYFQEGAAGAIASGPDGRIYFASGDSLQEYRWDESEEEWEMARYERTVHIKRLTPPSGTNSEPVVETVHTFAELTPINDLGVRETDRGEVRIYYSTGATGAGGTGEIYYLDEDGNSVLYFTLDPDSVDVASCDRERVGYWGGNFAFDDRGDRLFLSSGNHIPAAIFVIEDALLDGIADPSAVVRIQDFASSIGGMEYAGRNLLYFTVLPNEIHRLDLNEDETSAERDVVVFEDVPENRVSDVAVIGGAAEISLLPGAVMMRVPGQVSGQSSGLINQSPSRLIRDISRYQPLPELQGPKTPLK